MTDATLTVPRVASIPIADIKIGSKRREVRDIGELARSIGQLGLLNPITVTEDYRLIAGLHRLRAYELLGHSEIPAVVQCLNDMDTELAEIDENLVRNDLTILERAQALRRRQEIYEARHPDAVAGVRRATGMNDLLGYHVDEIVSPTFAEDTAAKTNRNPRTIQQDTQIARNIIEDVQDAIKDSPIADSKVDLLLLARMEPEEQKAVAEAILSDRAETVREAKKALHQEERRQHIAETVAALPEGQFAVVYADPPWSYDNSGLSQSAASHYETMTIDDICALDVAAHCVPETVLFLWATSPLLPDALRVMDAWGFTYKASMVWDKGQAPGIGWFVQTEHELLLIATREANTHPAKKPRSVVHIPPTRHSAKPEEFYDIIEAMYRGPYVELFARRRRPGWDAWGNEV